MAGGADAVATYQVDLKDGIAGPATSAEKALEGLRGQLDKDQKALNSLNKAMKNLQSGTTVNVGQFRALDAQIKATKDKISQAQGAIVDLGGALGSSRRPASSFKDTLEVLRKQAQSVGGPLGGVAGQLGTMKAMLAGGALTLGVAALAAGLAALVVAAVAATGAIFAYGLAQADARRSELLHLEGMTKMISVWGIAAGSAKEIQGAIDRVSASSALGRQEIGSYAQQLYKMGMRGQNLSDALEGVAIKASTQGQAAASQFMGLAQSIALTGGSVKKLSDTVKQRLGGIAAKQMLSLGVIGSKLKENFGRLFDELPIEGVLAGFRKITDMFSLSTESGIALREVIKLIFVPLSKAFEYIAPIAKRFFQGMILGAEEIAIVALKAAVWVKKAFGGMIPDSLGLAAGAMTAGKVAMYLLAAGFVAATGMAVSFGIAVIPVLVSVAGALWGMVAAGAALAAPFLLGAVAIGAVLAAGYQLYRLWKEIDWTDLGSSILGGIVSGLKSAKKWLLDTMKDLAFGALDTFKSALGIHSPSKEFAKLGVQLPAGVRDGIERGSPALESSVNEMVQPANLSMAAPSSKENAPSSSGALTIGEIHVHTAATDSKGIASDFRAALEDVLSGLLVQKGAPA